MREHVTDLWRLQGISRLQTSMGALTPPKPSGRASAYDYRSARTDNEKTFGR